MQITGKPIEIIKQVSTLDEEKIYHAEIGKSSNNRSLEQNRFLWKLIHALAKATNHEDMEIYCTALEKADAKSDYVISASLGLEELRKHFRGAMYIRTFEHGGNDFNVFKVYIGSSKMNTKEMTELLDIVIQMCEENGVSTYEN